jgi:type II secretory pathway pseudopilin PulG
MHSMNRSHGKNHLIKLELGFNLKELVVVIVILATSAAIVIFSLGGITTRGAVAACNTNATTVATALGEFNAVTGGDSKIVTPALLTSDPTPVLASFPSSPDYAISIVAGQVMVAAPKSSAPVPYGTAGACDNAGTPAGTTSPAPR